MYNRLEENEVRGVQWRRPQSHVRTIKRKGLYLYCICIVGWRRIIRGYVGVSLLSEREKQATFELNFKKSLPQPQAIHSAITTPVEQKLTSFIASFSEHYTEVTFKYIRKISYEIYSIKQFIVQQPVKPISAKAEQPISEIPGASPPVKQPCFPRKASSLGND